MDFLFSQGSPLFDYLEPFDLLKMLHFTKAARRAAIPKLKAFQAAPQTASQQIMFDEWIKNPQVSPIGGMVRDINRMNRKFNGAAGSFRFGSIQQENDAIRKRIVLLCCTKTHGQETSCAALFDSDGTFVAYYELKSRQWYEPYHGDHVDYSSYQHSQRPVQIQTTAGFHLPANSEARWKIREQSLDWFGQVGFEGDVTLANHALFQLFYGLLSPTEASMVLMHALSSDTRVIYVYTHAVFDNLERKFDFSLFGFQWIYEDAENAELISDAVYDWKQSLPGI